MDRPYIHEFIKQIRTLNKTYLSADLVPPVNPGQQQADAVQPEDGVPPANGVQPDDAVQPEDGVPAANGVQPVNGVSGQSP